MTETPELSFVFPCLNEEETIETCLTELTAVLNQTGISYEIIVADNGSTDRSVALAEAAGACVVPATKRGYGEALKAGFAAAKGTYVAFADIDGSYPLSYLPQMYQTIAAEDADMVIASRMTGKIEDGAMPFLHRYVGTPVLTKFINLFFNGTLSDCNSGFRIFKKSAYETWHVHSSGMEFASELLIKALKHKAKLIEIPAGLRPDKRSKAPHLNTWRDGMRHLLFILSEAPRFFETLGLIAVGGSTLLQILCMLIGPVTIGGFSIFDYHSRLILTAIMLLGLQSWILAASLYVFKPTENPGRISRFFITLKEETLFFSFVSVLSVMVIGFIALLHKWISLDFSNLHILNPLIDFLFFVLLLGGGSFGLLQIHILKRISTKDK